ncbi:hypothetical protein SKB08_14465, partial [Enterococcus faecium]
MMWVLQHRRSTVMVRKVRFATFTMDCTFSLLQREMIDQVNKEATSLIFLPLDPFWPAMLWSTWMRVMEHCPA